MHAIIGFLLGATFTVGCWSAHYQWYRRRLVEHAKCHTAELIDGDLYYVVREDVYSRAWDNIPRALWPVLAAMRKCKRRTR